MLLSLSVLRLLLRNHTLFEKLRVVTTDFTCTHSETVLSCEVTMLFPSAMRLMSPFRRPPWFGFVKSLTFNFCVLSFRLSRSQTQLFIAVPNTFPIGAEDFFSTSVIIKGSCSCGHHIAFAFRPDLMFDFYIEIPVN